ncbi:MAG: ankyrin repeat domain-containing protein [Rhodospirillales bacterium]|nr:ankyrin repeat domain-containing protein [Rhodospirillales bacterium]
MTRCLKAGTDLNARTKSGSTPLHRAAARDNAEAVASLLDAGADGGARNKAGQLPVDLAEEEENEKLRNSPVYRRLNDARYR